MDSTDTIGRTALHHAGKSATEVVDLVLYALLLNDPEFTHPIRHLGCLFIYFWRIPFNT